MTSIAFPHHFSSMALQNFVTFLIFAIFVALLQNFVIFVNFITGFNPGHILASLAFDSLPVPRSVLTGFRCIKVWLPPPHPEC